MRWWQRGEREEEREREGRRERGCRGGKRGFGFSATMETRSQPGEPDARMEEPAKEDLSENKQIERFDIPLDSLKRMFEKPAAGGTAAGAYTSTVSLATVSE